MMEGRATAATALLLAALSGPAAGADILRGPNGQGDILKGANPAPDILRGPALPPGTPVDTRIDPGFCRQLAAHRPVAGVEHVPGADRVNGRPVPPADLPGGAATALPVRIPVTLDMIRRLGLPMPGPAAGLPRGAEVGALTLEGNRLLFNGQPIGPAAEEQVFIACGRRP